ncbi:Fungal Zn(2)-Cys(6) binuclear cluster domain-containing protein [Penicillium ucsense]|uniref:Fungal Zn(2)-Cys(6) binuclear cluster domain-containing protein n=1 Tax=Penicillium ucsense TaxID=2839758 RepID=A0A8J8WM09_9EURO|nr:Fungal Zn(2)-Cys(6) binuclear cluster domain-containing protein [Penicillium ucsense]KAF7738534.1 Fungal Zn(2)-Cys(6) binuclear cluster domain-containing protein [Penicillium ucsense]
MPRPRRPGAPEPKRRSRNGCWPCKARKVKCGEEKPSCLNCQRQDEHCDYSVRLNWSGRSKRPSIDSPAATSNGLKAPLVELSGVVRFDAADGGDRSTPGLSGRRVPADGFINFKLGDFGSSEDASPSSNTTLGTLDAPTPRSSSGIGLSPSQSDNPTKASSQGCPPSTSGLFELGRPRSSKPAICSPSASSADERADFQSLPAFVFSSNPISQPISFLRDSSATGQHSELLSHSREVNRQHIDTRATPHEDHGLSFLLNDIDEPTPTLQLNSSSGHDATATGTVAIRSLSTGNRNLRDRLSSTVTTSDRDSRPLLDKSEDLAKNEESIAAQHKWHAYLTSVTDNYGFDNGRPDRDLTLNNDHAAIDINSAIDGASPASQYSNPPAVRKSNYSGYYASPVAINIPRYLSPLPQSLLKNPINLLYFHHFVDHTSKMLVPHDCEKNPFLSVLPSMAVADPNLLNLVLAYSASHRARYIGHPEPANRIAHWVSDVFPTLRVALEASKEDITDSHLATAILLLSLKIVSPATFEVPIPWQSHLKLARDLFIARSDRLAKPGNQVGAFFARWLGYIDTMGALSCRQVGPPLMMYHHVLAESCRPQNFDEHCVDCFTGFSPRTGFFLLRLAQLVQQCDNDRFDQFGNFNRDWHPSADMVMEADALLSDFDDLGELVHADPTHHVGAEADDMMSTERAFRCAGLVHLHRRVLESSPDSFPVQDALRKLISALDRMGLGTSTEVCSLLPLFTAGCESRDSAQRMKVLDRLLELEKSGLKQMQNARRLMQHCWERELLWIALADGQFLG